MDDFYVSMMSVLVERLTDINRFFGVIIYHKTMTCNGDARDEKNCEIIF